MCGGSPLIWFSLFDFLSMFGFYVLVVGENTQGRIYLDSRSPLSEPVFVWFFKLFPVSCRGEYTGEL